MKKTKTFLLAKLLLVLTLCMLAFPAAACGQDKPAETGEEKTAEYYYAATDAEYTISLAGTSYNFEIAGNKSEGTFNLKGETLIFNPKSGEAINATLKDDELSLTYNGENYVFLEKIEYSVTFELDGGTGVNNATVINGKTVARPASDPVKAGKYVFIDWYDSADFDNEYDFAEPVRQDTVIYAKFIKNEAANVFEVNLYDGENLVGTVETVNGVLYHLPQLSETGKTFLGWWYSQYDNAEKLSYQYTNQQIGANGSLFAVWASDKIAVSAGENKITWSSAGVNVKYDVKITEPDANVVEQSVVVTYINYTFDQPGNYVIEVTGAGKTGAAYYRNKGLDKVTVFTVEGNVLTFNSVAGAEGYYLTVECDNEAHDHSKKIDLGNKTEYDFTTCGMSENGLTFTVETYAKGFVGAVSEPYVLNRTLNAISDLAIDAEGDYATWSAVDNAEYYKVTVKVGEEVKTFEVTETTADLREFSGNITVTVQPVARCYNSPAAAEANFEKVKLATPSDFRFKNGKFTWTKVPGATMYVVKIGEKEFSTSANEFTLTEKDYAETGYAPLAAVKAVGGALVKDSNYTTAINIGEGALAASFRYENGKLLWDGVFGATGYSLKVDGEEVVVNEKVNEYALTLAKNQTSASVKYFRGDVQSEWVDINITAYKVTYATGVGREEDYPVQYAAVGDLLKLDALTRKGYEFGGWYLDGEKISSGTTLRTEKDITVSARWVANEYTVTLNTDKGGTLEQTTVTVKFGEAFTLPVPASNNKIKSFAGWYTETQGAGILYAKYDGTSITEWNDAYNVTLYAKWVDIFVFDLITNGTAYSVSKGDGIGYVSSVTIPETYEGLPVTTVEGSAFDGCSSLVEINIPDSVTNIELGIEGGYTAGSAFNGCRNLLYVNVYPTKEVTNPKFMSHDGVLYEFLTGGGVSLKYYPKYREGAYVIPDYVTELPSKSLYSKTYLTELVIPEGIKKIGANAFQSCSKLTKIVFIDAGPDAPEIALGKDVFKSNSALVEITLPSNISNITATMFDGCSKLEKIVLTNNPHYTTKDGVLCEINEVTGQANKIIYFPKAKDGEYTIPVGITTIGEEAFKDCEKLTKVVIPGYVTLIEKRAFYSCGALVEVQFDGKTTDGDLAVETEAFYSCTKLTEVTLPANLKTLKAYAFGGIVNLKTVYANCDRSTLDFEDYAFHNSADTHYGYVERLVLGKNMAVVDINGVFGSNKLVSVEVDPENQYYASLDGVLFDKAMLNLVYFPGGITGTYTIPGTVTSIGTRVFQSKEISGIVIGKNITSIGDQAFNSCKNLVSVTFEAGGESELIFGTEVFFGCSALPSIELPERLAVLGDGAFKNCSLLTSVYIPKNVSSIVETEVKEYVSGESGYVPILRTRVFENCNSLVEIVVDPENKNYASVDGVLYGRNEKGVISKLMVCPRNKGGVVDIADTVTEIANKAFYYNKGVTEITFSKGLTSGELSFGRDVFYMCESLSKVSLPQGLTTIGAGVFYYCESLEEIFIPKTVTLIENNAFNKCYALKKIVFEDGYIYKDVVDEETGETKKEIANYLEIADGRYESDQYGGEYYYGAFANTQLLEEVTLPARLKSLGDCAFANGTGLKKVSFAGDIELISSYAFTKCESLSDVDFGKTGKLKEIGYSAFKYTAIKTLALPEGLETLGQYAFAYVDTLEELSLPASLKTTSVGSPSSPNFLSGYTFMYCTNLKTVTFAPNSQLESIGSSMFWKCESLESIVIPKSVKSIGISAFRQLKNVTSITFEEGSKLETIENYVFAENPKLESFVIPKSVKTIGSYAFEICPELTSITFEEGSNIESIGNNAFMQTGLTEFAFPKTPSGEAIDLGDALFAKCQDLKTVYVSSSVASFEGVFSKCSSIEKLVIAGDSKHFQVSGDNVRLIVNVMEDGSATAIRYVLGTLPETEVVIPEGFTEISANAFEGQTNITRVVIPSSMKVIGKRAFANCFNLKEVVFADGSRPTFDAAVFSGCTSLEEIDLPEGTTVVSNYMFDGCIKLRRVGLPDSITQLGTAASAYSFRSCRALTSITLPAGLTVINNYVFQNSGLQSISIPGKVTKLGTYVFDGCRDLETFTLENGANVSSLGSYLFQYCVKLNHVDLSSVAKVTALPSYIFRGCEALSDVKLNDGLKSFGNYAFNGCSALKTIEVPSNLTYFGTYCFQNSGLTSITIPATVKVLGTNATSCTTSSSSYIFDGCKNLETVNMPDTLTKIGGYVFRNCEKLKNIDLSKVVLLGTYSFAGCTSLESVDLTSLQKSSSCGTFIFEGCTALKEVEFANVPTSLGTGMFKDCTSLAEITLPTTLTSVPARMLQNTAISTITIPALVTNLGNYTDYESTTAGYSFGYCKNLTEVKFAGTKCEGIGYGTFRGCTNLTEFNMPSSVGRIRGFAFAETGLTKINIPAKIYQLGKGVFAECKLTSITVAGDNEDFTAVGNILYSLDMTEIYYHPLTAITIDYSGIADTNGALYGNENATEIVIPEGVTEIPAYMFYGFKGLTKITLPESLVKIGDYAFYGCTGLKEIVLPAGLERINQNAFQGSGLESIVIPENVNWIGTYAFASSALKSAVINCAFEAVEYVKYDGTISYKANTNFGDYIFGYCTELASVTVNDKFTHAGDYMFFGCTALKEFTLPETFLRSEKYAFAESGLESIVIPEKTYYLGEGTFARSALKTATIAGQLPEGAATSLFEDCKQLVTVNCMFIKEIEAKMFNGCSALENLNYDPQLIERIYANALNYCTSLDEIVLDSGTVLFMYASYIGWTPEQTIRFTGNGRDFAALEEDFDWYNGCDAKIVFGSETQE